MKKAVQIFILSAFLLTFIVTKQLNAMQDTKEIWKPVKGYEGRYEVSNLGNVRSLPWIQKHSSGGKSFLRKGRNIKIRVGVAFNGYSNVMLDNNSLYHHRVVAIAFIPNPENKPFINHKNGIKTDNRIENLEWVTRSENAKHSFKIGLQSNKGENHPQHKLTWDLVESIRKRYSTGESSWKIYKSMNVSYTTIKDVIKKSIW